MLALLFSVLAGTATAYAAEERYDYDALGRLIRVIDEQGRVTEYVYDPAGNILQVIGAGAGSAQPPLISSGPLGDFRRNEFREVTVSGSNLTGVAVRASNSGIDLSNVVVSASSVSFRVAAGPAVPLGTHQVIFQSATGSASVELNVVPGATLALDPLPIAVPPDKLARKFALHVSNASTQPQTFNVSIVSPAIATVASGTVSVPAGQTTADIGVIGVAAGSTVLRVSHATFDYAIEVVVTVSPAAGNQIYFTRPVGIVRGVPGATAPQTHAASKSVGIVRGSPAAVAPTDPTTISKQVGIVRGTAAAVSPTGTAVTPLVGITKP